QQTATVADASVQRLDAAPTAAAPAIDAWLQPGALLERQTGVRERVEEVRARMAAATQAPADGKEAAPQPDPEQQKLLERVAAALPLVVEGSTAMDRARTALGDKKLADAVGAERDAIVALSKAVELFADLKHTIDIASATQKQVVQLLGDEAAKEMKP